MQCVCVCKSKKCKILLRKRAINFCHLCYCSYMLGCRPCRQIVKREIERTNVIASDRMTKAFKTNAFNTRRPISAHSLNLSTAKANQMVGKVFCSTCNIIIYNQGFEWLLFNFFFSREQKDSRAFYSISE